MRRRKNVAGYILLIAVQLVSLLLSGCTPGAVTTPAPFSTKPLTNTPTLTVVPVVATPTTIPASVTPAATPISRAPTATPLPLPTFTLKSGDFYFSIADRPSFIFSRNPTGKTQADFDTVLEWAHQGGSRLIRVHLTHGWWEDPWINPDGTVNETWAKDWERFFDQAAADGIYLIPVFGVWADWNNGTPDWGSPLWLYNPLNAANGGPVEAPGELFQLDSATQQLWLKWMKTLVERWQGRENIVAWEIFSEINIASGAPGQIDPKGGVAETAGVDFTKRTTAVIRDADPRQRPLTLSLAGVYQETDQWAEFYHLPALDFIEIHPYTDQLDRELIANVSRQLAKYNKPVFIGESGLWSLNRADKAAPGIRHAIWAGVVSGAMNGRALWDQDGYSIYFYNDRTEALRFMEKYAATEQAAANFAGDLDVSGFKPLTVNFPARTKVWGGAIGSDKTIVGWFRDAACEPPDWNLLPQISGQTITIVAPGSASTWQVDFYDTRTGTKVIASTTVTRQGAGLTISLPDFTDDLAFKAYPVAGAISTSVPPPVTDLIAGQWMGTITNEAGNFSTRIELSIQPSCQIGQVCGTVTAPQLPCSGKLVLQEITGDIFVFMEQGMQGATFCASGGYESLQLQADGTLSFRFTLTSPEGEKTNSSGRLARP
ncbi:hypothetical protein TFLX_03851 [Thermoflexales bacterium]|nr:hypothetical protein TFLX_03851 [Thermoflexales bacterium]